MAETDRVKSHLTQRDRDYDTLDQWFKENANARPAAYAIMANAYLGVEPPNYNRAINWMEKAIAKAKELGEEPKEGWYRNVAALYMEVEHVSKALQSALGFAKNCVAVFCRTICARVAPRWAVHA